MSNEFFKGIKQLNNWEVLLHDIKKKSFFSYVILGRYPEGVPSGYHREKM